jgi:nucleotide-binding universal stress UspA family protein
MDGFAMFHRLLVPLDGSRLAESVLPIAERLGEQASAAVILLHVLERGAPSAIHGERHLQKREEAQVYLAEVAARLENRGIAVETHAHEVPEGDVPRSIADHAVEENADLILLCTHGSGGVHHLLFGSVAQQVLKRGTIPVLLARPAPDSAWVVFQPERILVPLDGTAAAECALRPAAELSHLLHAGVHLVMVVATSGTVRGEQQAIAQALPTATRATLELIEAEAGDYLASVAAGLARGGARVSTEVRRGDTTTALADEAAEPGVGLVVAATHGRAGVQAIWAGSVTARLLARTRAPILLLRMIEG